MNKATMANMASLEKSLLSQAKSSHLAESIPEASEQIPALPVTPSSESPMQHPQSVFPRESYEQSAELTVILVYPHSVVLVRQASVPELVTQIPSGQLLIELEQASQVISIE